MTGNSAGNNVDHGWRPHPDFSSLSIDELAAEEAIINDRIKCAVRDDDEERWSWYRDQMRLLNAEKARRNGTANGTESHQEEKAKPSLWAKAKAAPDFCAEEDKEIEGHAKDLLFPSTITVIAAPRGIGKTLVLHDLAVAMAKGEYFRGEKVNSLRGCSLTGITRASW
jgi:hypothetical protein